MWVEELYYEAQPIEIHNALDNAKVSFFEMGGKCYIQDGKKFLVYDGEAIKNVEDDPYIPTLTISRPPAGGGEPFEDFNLLGKGFKDSFSADGTAKEYHLSLKGLDTTTVKAEVNGTTINEGSGLTVDRANGKVTFTTAPTEGTNNVIITAYKTQSDFPNRIKKCTFNVAYGGDNDTYTFVSGNPDEKNTIWRSGLNDKGLPDASYWPENSFYKPGGDNEAVQGFSKQYDYLLIEKEYSKWSMTVSVTDGKVLFPLKPINEQVGTLARGSIQIIENNPVSLDRKGLYSIVSTAIRDERNIKHLSENVDSKLLSEPNLEKAISVDFDKKYWLVVNGNVYVYDYRINEWYFYDNIHATCFLVMGEHLYFGGEGLVYRFKKRNDIDPYHDDWEPINAHWHSKLLNFGFPERYKLINRVFYTLKPDIHTSSALFVRTDKSPEKEIGVDRLDQFSFIDIDFNKFTFVNSDIPQEISQKVKEKKISHLQLKLQNNTLNESLGVVAIGIKYGIQNEVK